MNNLRAEMARNNITTHDIAKLLNISERTVRNKIKGISDFSWSEVNKIKKCYFNNLALEYLFKQNSKVS